MPRPPPLPCRSRLWRRIWSTFTAMSETFWAMAWIRSMRPAPGGSLSGRSQGEPVAVSFPGRAGLSLPAKAAGLQGPRHPDTALPQTER